jgi:hypothetical protein
MILDHMGLTAAMLKDNKVEEAVGQTVALAKYPNVLSRSRPRRVYRGSPIRFAMSPGI